MKTDIVETPDFCEPDESPQQVLEYTKDVISDYTRKRVSLNGEERGVALSVFFLF